MYIYVYVVLLLYSNVYIFFICLIDLVWRNKDVILVVFFCLVLFYVQ